MSISVKRVVFVGVAVLFCFGLGRAALSRFQEKREAIFKACRDDLQRTGQTRASAKVKYFTPEIHMVSSACLTPGGSGEVVVKGKFPPDTKFVFENDNLEVVKESLTGGEYRATLKAPPGTGPQTASVLAITPLTCLTARHDNAVVVGGRYEWDMDAANGWKIIARSTGGKACGERGRPEDLYDMQFFRKGEASAFEKRSAQLFFSVYEKTNYRFRVSSQSSDSQTELANMQRLMQRMGDPKLSDAEREKLMKQLQEFQANAQANLKKMTDPAYMKAQQEKQQEFGCEMIQLEVKGDSFTGEMRCSPKVGNRIAVTGKLKPLV